MNIAVSGNVYDDDDEFEDKLNTIIEGKKMAPNASYFAFTATPKNKTLEMFGKKMFDEHGNPILNDDGTQKANPHYVYTMKQAIEEKFILDVLRYYTPYESFYHIVKTVEMILCLIKTGTENITLLCRSAKSGGKGESRGHCRTFSF